jgi:hypothetical protein
MSNVEKEEPLACMYTVGSNIRQEFMYIDGTSPCVIHDTQRQISITSQQLSESVLLGSPMPDRFQVRAGTW